MTKLNYSTRFINNEPGSVTWLATKYLKTVSWRNHTGKLTTFWPQNISFWPKINIPSSYFTILMLNCLENTLKLQFDSYVTAVKFLTKLIFKTTWLDIIPTLLLESVLILCWSTVKLLTGMQKTLHSLSSCAENFPLIQISSILSVNFTRLWHKCQSVLMGQLVAPQQDMLGALIVWWPASFWLQWTMAEGTVHTGSAANFPTKPTEE